MAKHGPKEAPVGDYPERPYDKAKAKPEDIAKAEARPEQDQIVDYHKRFPTLKKDDTEEPPEVTKDGFIEVDPNG